MTAIFIILWVSAPDNAQQHHWLLVNIGSGNGLVPDGKKPLPELMFIKFYNAVWYHQGLTS